MEISNALRAYLGAPRFAVLATINADGSLQQTVMWYLLDGDTIVMNTTDGRHKTGNLRRDPRASICVADGYRFVTLEGSGDAERRPDRVAGRHLAAGGALRWRGAREASGRGGIQQAAPGEHPCAYRARARLRSRRVNRGEHRRAGGRRRRRQARAGALSRAAARRAHGRRQHRRRLRPLRPAHLPDADTVLYTLAGVANAETGWGVAGETFERARRCSALRRAGVVRHRRPRPRHAHPAYAAAARRLDADRGAGVAGGGARRAGAAAADVRRASCDDRTTPDGDLAFQDYFVRRQHQDPVLRRALRGIERRA